MHLWWPFPLIQPLRPFQPLQLSQLLQLLLLLELYKSSRTHTDISAFAAELTYTYCPIEIFNKKETTDQHASATGRQIYQYLCYLFIYLSTLEF